VKILFCVTRSDTLGGAQIHVADLALAMQERGEEVVIVTGGNGVFCRFIQRKGLRYISCDSLSREASFFRDISATLELRKLFRSENPDIVALHSVKAGLLGRIACRGLSPRVTYTVHGWSVVHGRERLQRFLYWMLERFLVRWTDAVIFVSRHDRRLAIQHGLPLHGKSFLVRNALPDLSDIRPAQALTGVPCTRIVSVARFQSPKDHLTLLTALAALSDLSWTLDLIGDGPDERSAREAVEELGLGDRVRFLGLQEGVDRLLPTYHLFVLSSRSEGFPLSILEAMRAGLPVVASEVGGIPEAVKEGTTGYLVEAGNVAAMSHAIGRLLRQPEDRTEKGMLGRERFLECFELSRMAERTHRVYDFILRTKIPVHGQGRDGQNQRRSCT
jgi:glycosyltransferase involved in cell wall biosynthesis